MRLFIAEKPSLARAIAEGLGKSSKDSGCIRCVNDTVTWCFGHLLELCYPEDYKPGYASWRREYLPIIPENWKSKAKPKAGAQLKIIGKLLKEAKEVVNAGDPDREGQLLVDEVLEHFNYRGKVSRIWLASLDARSVEKALNGITDNTRYAPLRDSARARMQADWLVGMNATRAMTIAGREAGRDTVLSLGRVQTPTLALVVHRDREIASFTPTNYYELQAVFGHLQGDFTATFTPGAGQEGLDANGYLTDETVTKALSASAKGATGSVLEFAKEIKTKSAPLPHCLSSLQKEASAKLSMTAKQVLDTAQALYEKRLTTYPRADCRYLPEEQFDAATSILAGLATIHELGAVAGNADPSLKSSAWNTKKITAHHAIIPTGEVPGNLDDKERALYTLIATAYCLQFYPAMRFETQRATVAIANTRWTAHGRLVLEAGWSVRHEADALDEQEKGQKQLLPPLSKGEVVSCTSVQALQKKTAPPSRFTEGTLIEAMANVHRFVTDSSAKSVLKENEGIGTEATRAGIIETLKAKQFLVIQKKAIVATQLGQELIDLTPTLLKDPVTTASWEIRLNNIAQGKEHLKDFMAEQVSLLPDLLTLILGKSKAGHACPDCGASMYRRKGKKAGSWFWGCSGYPSCKTTAPDNNGVPGTPASKPQQTGYACTACGKPLIRRETDRGAFFGCSGYPACKKIYQIAGNGEPETRGKK